jgi:allantoinase
MLVDQFDEMIELCDAHPLVMTVSLHAFVVGQPHRLRRLRAALKYCTCHPAAEKVWWTTPGAISDFCYALPPGVIPGAGPSDGISHEGDASSKT